VGRRAERRRGRGGAEEPNFLISGKPPSLAALVGGRPAGPGGSPAAAFPLPRRTETSSGGSFSRLVAVILSSVRVPQSERLLAGDAVNCGEISSFAPFLFIPSRSSTGEISDALAWKGSHPVWRLTCFGAITRGRPKVVVAAAAVFLPSSSMMRAFFFCPAILISH